MSDDPQHELERARWHEDETVLLRFERAWQRDGHAAIVDFLPPGAPSERLDLLCEMIHIDMEYRWRGGDRASIEEYLAAFPQIPTTSLLAAELQVSRQFGREVTRDELLGRFPDCVAEITELSMAVECEAQSTVRSSSRVAGVEDQAGLRHAPKWLAHYEQREELGRGTFAIVHRAWDLRLQREVAIKSARPEFLAVPELRERMLREARAAARLQHPAIVPIFEVIEDDDDLHIVSELIEGETLEARLRVRRLSAVQAASWAAQIADALAYAHQCGIVHRDVKPANVMLRRPSVDTHHESRQPAPTLDAAQSDDQPLLTDFGLAHQTDAGATLTQQGDLLGTPAFMSPEQARGDTRLIDGRSDVYSLGVVLYQLLAGQLPFTGSSSSVLLQVQRDSPAPPRNVCQDIPRDLETICLKCLEKDRADRFQDATDLAADLHRFLRGEPIQARPVSAIERIWKWSKRHPTLTSLAIIILVLGGFLLGLAVQLSSVRTQRDRAENAERRAKSAEQEKTSRLADSYSQAGLLAMQRGRFRDALRMFNQSITLGHGTPDALRIKMVEANFLLRNFDAAAAILAQKTAKANSAEAVGSRMLWRGELALRPSATEAESALAFYRRALERELPEADRIYIEGMISEDSQKAVSRFELALAINPFHHRARSMLLNMLVALGRLEEAGFQTTVGQQLFPEDPHFKLMEGVILAARSDRTAAERILTSVTLDDVDRKAWQDTYQLVDELVGLMSDTPSLTANANGQIVRQLLEAEGALSVVADYGWRFPPILNARLDAIRRSLKAKGNLDHSPTRPLLEKLVHDHPEGSLLVFLGEFQLADDDLEAARDSYLAAIDTPSLLRNHAHAARLGVIAPAVKLALVLQKDIPENMQHVLEAMRGLDPDRQWPVKRLQLFTQLAAVGENAELSRIWLQRFAAHPDADSLMAATLTVNVLMLEKRFVDSIVECDRILAGHPKAEYIRQRREEALGQLDRATP